MEFSVREWTIIVGVLLIVAVFLDGYRRVRNERSNRIRVSLSKQAFNQPAYVPPPVDEQNPELPGGGARIVAKRRSDDLNLHQSVPVMIEPVAIAPEPIVEPEPESEFESEFEAEVDSTPLEPILIEPEPEPDVVEPVAEVVRVEPAFVAPKPKPEVQVPPRAEPKRQSKPVQPELRQEELLPEDDDADDEVDEVVESPLVSAAARFRSAVKSLTREKVPEQQPEPEPPEPQEVLVVNVLCKDGAGFKGPDLLQLLLACDLRFGKLNIFHRYEKANGKGPVQFSVANLVEPGVFNLDAIDDFSTPGVSFFLTLPGPEKPVVAFNYMVETAQVLVRHLHAELRDDAHSVMTAQTIEHCRQRIRDFERKQLTLQL